MDYTAESVKSNGSVNYILMTPSQSMDRYIGRCINRWLQKKITRFRVNEFQYIVSFNPVPLSENFACRVKIESRSNSIPTDHGVLWEGYGIAQGMKRAFHLALGHLGHKYKFQSKKNFIQSMVLGQEAFRQDAGIWGNLI